MITIPSKSQYIEAPFTLSTFAQSVKDSFEFVGFETIQTSDDSMTFDSEYWRANQTLSTVNVVPESEQLVYLSEDWPEMAISAISSGATVEVGAEAFVTTNTDNSVPFKLVNVIKPRKNEINTIWGFTKTGLKSNTNYTVSLWARASDNDSGGNLVINSGPNNSSPSNYKNNTNLGSLSTTWQRYSYTINTGGNNSLHHSLGRNNTWISRQFTNLLSKSDRIINSVWNKVSVSVAEDSGDLPPLYTADTGLPVRVTWTAGSESPVYQNLQGLGPLAGRTFTFSIYAKGLTGAPYIVFDDSTGNSAARSTPSLIATEGGWTRYSTTFTFPAGTGTSGIINSIVWGRSGDSALLWGAQLEESSTVSNYESTETAPPYRNVRMYGSIEFSGLQIEEGTTATTYQPVRIWHFKPNPGGPVTYNHTIKNQSQALYYNVPGGVEKSVLSVESLSTYRSGFVVSQTFTNTASTSEIRNMNFNSYTCRPLPGMSESGRGFYVQSSTEGIRYISDGLRTIWGNGTSPMGNVYFTLTPTWNEYASSPEHRSVNFKVYGVLFKLSTPINYSTMTNVMGFSFHQKTPGNGRRKFVNIFLREDSTKVYMNIHTPVFNLNNNGVAESPGSLVLRITPAFTNNVSDSHRNNGPGWSDNYLRGFPVSRELNQAENFDKNSDTFVFTQGSADGFTYSINVNSSFKFKYMQADLINPPMSEDNGSMYSRYAIGLPESSYKNVRWYAHGPLIGDNTYGSGFGNFYRNGTAEISYSAPFSRFPEVFGDNVDADATFNSMITQMYCVAGNNNMVSSRGQLKNFYMMRSSSFLGVEGDLIIAEDGSKYFGLYKNVGLNSIAVTVKV